MLQRGSLPRSIRRRCCCQRPGSWTGRPAKTYRAVIHYGGASCFSIEVCFSASRCRFGVDFVQNKMQCTLFFAVFGHSSTDHSDRLNFSCRTFGQHCKDPDSSQVFFHLSEFEIKFFFLTTQKHAASPLSPGPWNLNSWACKHMRISDLS